MIDPLPRVDQTQLLHFISEYVQDWHNKTGTPVNGARLAFAIRHRFANQPVSQFGFERLSDAVRAAEDQSLVRRNWNVKHLEVFPPLPSQTASDQNQIKDLRNREFLRDEFWTAFLYFRQWQQSYFQRSTSSVITVDKTDADKYDQDTDYIRLEPAPEDIQKEWARNFLALESLADADRAPINVERWWQQFPEWLKQQGDPPYKAWLAYRSQRVLEFAKDWAKRAGVPVENVLKPPRQLRTLPEQVTPSCRTHDQSAPHHVEHEEAIRKAILAAVADMPLHDLLALPIPLRHVLRHFRPR